MTEPSTITRLTAGTPLDDEALAALYRTGERHTPWLRVNFVTSLDGAAQLAGASAGLSSPADQHVMGLLRAQCDALLLGAGTLRVEGYVPPWLDERLRGWRRDQGLPADPVLVVVSGSLNLDPARPALADAPARPLVLTGTHAPADRRAALAATTEVVSAGAHTVDLAAAVALLHERGYRQILCEGGPHLFGHLVAADVVDELCLTVSPLLAGAGPGRITAGPASLPRHLTLRHVLATGSFLLLRYQRGT